MARAAIVDDMFSSMSKVNMGVNEEKKPKSKVPEKTTKPEPAPAKKPAEEEGPEIQNITDSTSYVDKVEEVSKPLQESKKRGRPKKEKIERKSVTILLPMQMYKDVEIALRGHDNNMTTYIRDLIYDDLQKNLEHYSKLPERREYF